MLRIIKKFFYIFLFILLYQIRAFPQSAGQDRSNILNLLNERKAAPLVSKGKITSIDYDTLGSVVYNPALMGAYNSIKTELNVNKIEDASFGQNRYLLYQNLWSAPLVYGSMAVGITFLDVADNPFGFSETYDVFLGYALPVYKDIYLGLGFARDLLKQSLSLGIYIPFYSNLKIYKNIGIWNLKYGGSVYNVLLARNVDFDNTKPIIHNGLEYYLFLSRYFKIKNFIEFGFTNDFIERTFHLGGEFIFFDLLKVSAGGYGNEIMKMANASMGIGLGWRFGYINVDLLYTRQDLSKAGNDAISFQVDLDIYGKLSRDVRIKVTNPVISPLNNDGEKDRCYFSFIMDNNEKVNRWRLTFNDSLGATVRELNSDMVGPSKNGKNLIRLPQKLMWDGRSDDGSILTDGRYSIKFEYISKDNVRYYRDLPSVVIDNRPPAARIFLSSNEVTISKKKIKSNAAKFVINFQDYDNNYKDIWNIRIQDQANQIVKKWRLPGDEFGSNVTWDLRDEYGKVVETGLYNLYIAARDTAGNKGPDINVKLKVLSIDSGVSLTLLKNIFSNKSSEGKEYSTVRFYPSLHKKMAIDRWIFRVLDARGKAIYQKAENKNKLPREIVWDGKNSKNSPAAEGLYFADIIVYDKKGNIAKSFQQELIIDNTPPVLNVEYSSGGDDNHSLDEYNNFYRFRIRARDNSGFWKWRLDIAKPGMAPYRTFSGAKKPPGELMWHGEGNHDSASPKGGLLYYANLNVWDVAGNKSVYISQPLKILDRYSRRLKEQKKKYANEISFSPNGDNRNDSVDILLEKSIKKGAKSWEFRITNEKGQAVYKRKGDGEPPKRLRWDGKSDSGASQMEGDYFSELIIYDKKGKALHSSKAKITIDNSPPQVFVSCKPRNISPNGDGINDRAQFIGIFTDGNGIEKWMLRIYHKWHKGRRSPVVREYRGTRGSPIYIDWDGRDNYGILVKPFTTYSYYMQIWDKAGNTSIYRGENINVGAVKDVSR